MQFLKQLHLVSNIVYEKDAFHARFAAYNNGRHRASYSLKRAVTFKGKIRLSRASVTIPLTAG
jgi:hypothetical protein